MPPPLVVCVCVCVCVVRVADDQPGGSSLDCWVMILVLTLGTMLVARMTPIGARHCQGDSRSCGGAVIKHGPLVIAVTPGAFPVAVLVSTSSMCHSKPAEFW
jgi:hypothetical protein